MFGLVLREPLTQEKVQRLFRYEQDTGLLFWKEPGHKRNLNKPAGYLCRGYWVVKFEGIRYPVHLIIWLYVYGKFPDKGLEPDHIDRNRSNNRITNLREVTRSQNRRNAKNMSSTGYKGVTNVSGQLKKPYQARASINGEFKYLGYFETAEEAYNARILYMREQGIPEQFID